MTTESITSTDTAHAAQASFTLTWRFPASKPVPSARSFTLRRAAHAPPPATLAAPESEASTPPVSGEPTLYTFQVDETPAASPGVSGELIVQMTRAPLAEDSGAAAEGDGSAAIRDNPMIGAAAEAWVTCYGLSDARGRELLGGALGSFDFDGRVATRLLQHPRNYTVELVRLALEDAKHEDKDDAHDDPIAQSMLESALHRAVQYEVAPLLIGDDPSAPPIESEEGIVGWDARLARYLERLGQPNLARHLRKMSANQVASPDMFWSRWLPSPRFPALYRLTYVALALWRTKIRSQVVQMRRNPPALTVAMHEPMRRLFSQGHQDEQIDGKRYLKHAGDILARVSAVDASTLNEVFVKRGLEVFGSVTAHRLLRWQIITAHRQAIEKHPDPRVLLIQGGYAALAHDILGLTNNADRGRVRDVLEAEHACEIRLPPNGDFSRLLIRRELPTVGRQRANLELVLGTALLPHYVYELQAACDQSRERSRLTRLVPVLELPPFIGRDNEHGAQATLSMLLIAYLRDHARELVQIGGVQINPEELTLLAAQVSLPLNAARRILDRWVQDGTDGPAFLKRVAPHRYTLGDAHTPARLFLEEAGRREVEGSIAGHKSVAKKTGKLYRIGHKKLPA